jgi:threonyl-tRNA synthetase
MSQDLADLHAVRHSAAHVLAQAVKRLFPGVQLAIGPVIDDGFYYDFAYERSFTEADMLAIEAEMRNIIAADYPIVRYETTRAQLLAQLTAATEPFKVEILQAIPETETVTYYQQAEFWDLCRGPHVPSTGAIPAFKLMKVSGAFWRGDQQRPMLQRIYGTAWLEQAALDTYLLRLSEAEKRDHRKLGKQLALFHLQEEAVGMVFWHAHGWTIFRLIQEYLRQRLAVDYQEIRTPELLDRRLWERSGHWQMFAQNMFTCQVHDEVQAIKPMNCPGHVQVYNQGLKSYRDLPLRFAEFGCCHRYEPSGALHGLLRLRQFTQDDAHIFCTEAQLGDEVSKFITLLYGIYADFGFHKVLVRLSTRPSQRVGDEAMWDRAEAALHAALEAAALAYTLQPGEGAFYGPKIEFALEDCMGRIWQCGTMQVDFSMPLRLGAEYVAEDGARRVPVMLHRAVLGSIERFIGILLEETAGRLPFWLAPQQVAVLNITSEQAQYANQVTNFLQSKGLRVLEDLRNEKIGFKIREHVLQKIPCLVIVGAREAISTTVSVRFLQGEEHSSWSLEQLWQCLHEKLVIRGER